VVAAALIGTAIAGGAAHHATQLAQKRGEAQVDLELVLAVDVSYSMDLDELALQREGYAMAITSTDFLQALKAGPHGKVALTYFEWSTTTDQKIIVPWRIVDGPESADAVAAEIRKTPLRRASRTSISAAINFAAQLLRENPYTGLREVIDISGDGPNNSGEPVLIARGAALEKGITINGLPIMLKDPKDTMDIEHLDWYYEDCVIGGPGSFVIAVQDRDRLREAIRTKLVLEISKLEGKEQVIHVQARSEPRIPCTIGEQRWRERWGR
jgi:hypothetical protein